MLILGEATIGRPGYLLHESSRRDEVWWHKALIMDPSIHRFPSPQRRAICSRPWLFGIPGTSEGGTVQLKADAVMDQHPITRK